MSLKEKFAKGEFDSNFGDGSYKVLINGVHVLTKRIKNGKGGNYKGDFHIPYLNFEVQFSEDTETVDFVYSTFVDHVRKVSSDLHKDYYVGYLECNGRIFFWFELVKE